MVFSKFSTKSFRSTLLVKKVSVENKNVQGQL